ncbi:MAG TPA: DUF4426 domain-containing protein [Steroidobacteraceae bacterium]|nr:DUF4426 domain-containing protein [Steroidobacteraceae bacterium]
MRAGNSRASAWVSGNNRAPPATAVALLILAACGGSPEPVAQASPYLDPGFVESAEHRLHYALTPTLDLPAAIAGSYGIEQRKDLAVLTVAIAPRDPSAATALATPWVEADAVSLTGVRQPLALARRDEPGAATWIATVDVRHRVPITIEIRARASADGTLMRARLTREFRLE